MRPATQVGSVVSRVPMQRGHVADGPARVQSSLRDAAGFQVGEHTRQADAAVAVEYLVRRHGVAERGQARRTRLWQQSKSLSTRTPSPSKMRRVGGRKSSRYLLSAKREARRACCHREQRIDAAIPHLTSAGLPSGGWLRRFTARNDRVTADVSSQTAML